MKKIFSFVFALLPVFLFSQGVLQQWGGELQGVVVAPAGTNKWSITANFFDPQDTYRGNGVMVGDVLFSPAINTQDTCRKYTVDSIYYALSGAISVRVAGVTGLGTPSSSNSWILRETPNRKFPYIPPIGRDALRSCIASHYSMQVDTISTGGGGGGGVSVVSDRDDATYTHYDGVSVTKEIDVRDSISSDAGNRLSVGSDGRPYMDTVKFNQVFADKATCFNSAGASLGQVLDAVCAAGIDSVAITEIDATTRILILYAPQGEIARDTFTVGGAGDDRNNWVSVSATDTDSSYLASKIVAGTNVTIDTLNPGGNEQLQINASDTKYSVYNLTTGVWVVATDTVGMTFTKNPTTGEMVLTIPLGIDVKSGWVNATPSDADADNDIYFTFNYDPSVSWNTSMNTARTPIFRVQDSNGTPSRGSPQNTDNTLTWGVSAIGSGDIEIKLNDIGAFFLAYNIVFIMP